MKEQYVEPYMEELGRKRMASAVKELVAEAPRELVEAGEVRLETPEQLERSAVELKRKAKEMEAPAERLRKALMKAEEKAKEAEEMGLDISSEKAKLEQLSARVEAEPEAVEREAKELTRSLSQRVSEEKERRRLSEKVAKDIDKAEAEIHSAESMGMDVSAFTSELRQVRALASSDLKQAADRASSLLKDITQAREEFERKKKDEEYEKAVREKIQKEVAEDIAKRTMDELLSKPSFVQEAQVKVQMDYLRGRFPELEQWRDVLPEKSLRVIAEALAKKGAQKWEIRLPIIMEDLGKLVDKCRKLGWKVRPKDVKKILRDRGALKTPLTEEDKELQSVQMFVPWTLVELVWNNTPWKTKRAPVLKKTIEMMYKNLGAEVVEKLFRTALQMNAPPGYFVKERHVW